MAEHRKKIVHNFVSLSLVQGLSILFPLITFPYLLRVLGVENFGVFTLVQTFIMYFDLLVSFGFGLTATQYITRNLNDSEKIREIISAVYLVKFFLFGIAIVCFLLAAIFIPYLRENLVLILISAFYILGNLLFPDWYFQGIQKMRNITIVAFISKIISLSLVILLVKKNTDIVYAVVAVSAGTFVAGLMGHFILRKTFSWRYKQPEKQFLVNFFKETSYVFTSIIIAPLYSSVNIFILRIFSNPLMVGYYAIAEKIFSALGMLTSIANRTFYPHLSQLYHTSIKAYKKNVNSIVLMFVGAFVALALFQFFGAEFIVSILSGKKPGVEIAYPVRILQIMSFGLLFSPFVSFFFQLLIIQGQKKESIRNISFVVIINLITASLFSYFYSGKGMAINLSLMVFTLAAFNYLTFRKGLSKSIDEHAAVNP